MFANCMITLALGVLNTMFEFLRAIGMRPLSSGTGVTMAIGVCQ